MRKRRRGETGGKREGSQQESLGSEKKRKNEKDGGEEKFKRKRCELKRKVERKGRGDGKSRAGDQRRHPGDGDVDSNCLSSIINQPAVP